MNKNIIGAVAALALLAGIQPASAQNVEFSIINESSVDLHYFFASPSNEANWGEDLLADLGILESGYQATTYIGDGSDQCLYDFRFIGGEGEELVASAIDICSLDSYTLHD